MHSDIPCVSGRHTNTPQSLPLRNSQSVLGSEKPSSPPTSFYSGGNNIIKRLRKEIFKSKKMRARSLVSGEKERYH